ncbi:MAG: hypothetical protein AAB525_02795 [Patescibacteria group bacterium]
MKKTENLSKIDNPGIEQIRINILFAQIEESRNPDSALIPMALEELKERRDQLSDEQKQRLDEIITRRDQYFKEELEKAA